MCIISFETIYYVDYFTVEGLQMDYNASSLRQLIELLEGSLDNLLDEQLSLAAQWARQSDPLVMELTQRLIWLEETLVPLSAPENLPYVQYFELFRRAWEADLRAQWLSGFRGEAPALCPDWQETLARLEEPLSVPSPETDASLESCRQTARLLFQVQAPYFRQAGLQFRQLMANLA